MNDNRKPRALAQLESADDFSRRHIGPDGEQRGAMLRTLGLGSMEELVERAIPRAMDNINSARSLGRIGDRACNIAEYAIYYVKGEDVRHASPDELKEL